VPYFEQTFSLTGAYVRGELNIRQFGNLKDYHRTPDLDYCLNHSDLKRSAWLIDRLEMVNTAGARRWARLRRGLRALFYGTLTPNDDGDRLHQLVRAVEATVRPGIGRSRNQFAQTFTTADAETRDVLGQLYDMRSHVVHMHPVVDVLPEGDEAARIAAVNRRTRQADVLARDVLLNIDDLWRMSDADRQELWGPRLDIRTVE